MIIESLCFKELDESGGYSAVEVVASNECGAGGVIQMRQASVDYDRVCMAVIQIHFVNIIGITYLVVRVSREGCVAAYPLCPTLELSQSS